MLYAEELRRSNCVFHNYRLQPDTEIYIGESDNNDIICPKIGLGTRYASIRLDKNGWTLRERGNAGGAFVNGERARENDRGIREACLKAGDTIDLVGLRVIVGIGFLSLNADRERIRMASDKLKPLLPADVAALPDKPRSDKDQVFSFNRLPRRRLPLEPAAIEIKAPPMSFWTVKSL